VALTTDFVTAVRRQGSIPSSILDADILAIGDEEIQSSFIPLLESLRQNYFIREVTLSPDARGRVPIPPRAVGAALRSVQLSMGNGWAPLPLRDLGDADYVSGGALPDAYAVDGGSIILLPYGTSGSLRIRYAARPGKMVLATNPIAATVTAVTAGGTTTSIVSAFSGPATPVDIVSSGPAHQHKAIATTLSGAGPNYTVPTADLLELPIIGDVLSVGDKSAYVPLPEELFAALVHKVASNVLLGLGYIEEHEAQEKKAERVISAAKLYLMPRNEGNPKTVKGGLRRALGAGPRRGRW
jgi:hypothetical protein